MSLSGEAYIESTQKRAFELAVVAGGFPVATASEVMLSAMLKFSRPGIPPINHVDRALVPGDSFQAPKLGDPESDHPIHKLLSKTMLDEIPQLDEVRRGNMTLVGPRAYRPDHIEALFESLEGDDELREQWRAVRQKQKPGIISSFSIYSHAHNLEGLPEHTRAQIENSPTPAHRPARLDIYDYYNAGPYNDLRLIMRTFSMAISNYRSLVGKRVRLNTN